MVDEEKDNKRYFLGPDEETKYYIDPPSAEDIRGADWQYSKTYTHCLLEGITTNAEMLEILNRRGIIGPEFEQRSNELAEKLAELINKLEVATDIEDKRKLSIDVARGRDELFQWNQRLNGPMNHTAEQISDDARLEYLTSTMVFDSSGKKYWADYDMYLKEKSQAMALKARFEVMLYLQGLDSNFLDQTPEALAMKEVEADIIEKAKASLKAADAVMSELENEPQNNTSSEVDNSEAKSKKSRKKKD